MVKIIGEKQFEPISTSGVEINSLFIDSADDTFKHKNSLGEINIIAEKTNFFKFTAITTSEVEVNTLFVDSDDNLLKFKSATSYISTINMI